MSAAAGDNLNKCQMAPITKEEADNLVLGSDTSCPICGLRVNKPRRSDQERQNQIQCENEYYVHYIDRNSNHILQQYINPNTSEDKNRFKEN